MIAVTGASGEVGRRVVAGLARAGVPMRLVVRDASRAPEVAGATVAVASDYGARDEMRAAFEGVDTVFLIPAAEHADRRSQHRTAVDAAVEAGAARIVYLSFLGAAEDATFTLARDHWATERHVEAAGLPHAFLRMSMYMDFLPTMMGEDGVIAGPAGDGRVSAILRDDVAAAAVGVLADPAPHDGRTYELTGPEALSFADAAAELSRATGRTVTYRAETEEEAYASRAGYGAPDWEVRGWVTSYQAVAAGELERVTGDVERLAGRPPRSLAQHLADGRSA
jgi:NAD(P)H dehydrogenase (quinone)